MRMDFITFRSITPAQRGQRVLQAAGIVCALQRTPKQMAQQGCGYCLRLWPGDVARAVALLREQGVPMSKVYAGYESGPQELEV